MIKALGVLFLTLQPALDTQPDIAVTSQIKCGAAHFAVIQVSNQLAHESMFFPLSPLYTQGYTVHDIRLQAEIGGRWRLIGRGADNPPSGERELRPGEKFSDLFQLPTASIDPRLSRQNMRLLIPYRIGTTHGQVETAAFNSQKLAVAKNSVCPVGLRPR